MFTRQYYYYQAMKNFGSQTIASRWAPTEEERLAADLKNLSGVALPAANWVPYWDGGYEMYTDYAYSFSLAANTNQSISAPGVSYYGYGNPKSHGNIIVIGSGDNDPSLDDYCLQSIISSGISRTVSHSEIFYDEENDKWYVDETATFTRTLNEPVTVKEWGIYGATTKSGTPAGHMCLFRAVLPTPITLNSGDSIKFVIRFSMDANAGKED